LAEQVRQIDPSLASKILSKFRFREVVDSSLSKKVKNLNLKKVQSVKDWVASLSNADNVAYFTQKRIDDIKKNMNLLRYLDVLVHYVNSTLNVINPEYRDPRGLMTRPEISSYKLYGYVDPYHRRIMVINNIRESALRLKGAIDDGTAGLNGLGLMKTIMSIGQGPNLGMAPSALFSSSVMLGGGITGGNIQIERSSEIIAKYLKGVRDIARKAGFELSNDDNLKIESKVKALRDSEEDAHNLLKEILKMVELYQNTNGAIDLTSFASADREKFFEKHSNYLRVTSSFNKKSSGLLSIIEAFGRALLEVVKTEGSSAQEAKAVTTYPGVGWP